jgi:imidazole glycerol-phosphate synthase subunit HisH
MITIVDYGVGNIGALLNMFDYLGIDAVASGDAGSIATAEVLVLPGVGAFDKAMTTLRARQLVEPLNAAVLKRRIPVLGVCLGMQLLARKSEEGIETGLGWIEADVQRITVSPSSGLKVPNIGWVDIRATRPSPLFDPSVVNERFYFDHGYHMVCDSDNDVSATIEYGDALCCAVSCGNICGVQFHPEKSHRFGMRLLQSFANQAAQ